MGYISIGDKIDPNDWHENPRMTAEQITDAVLKQSLPPCANDRSAAASSCCTTEGATAPTP